MKSIKMRNLLKEDTSNVYKLLSSTRSEIDRLVKYLSMQGKIVEPRFQEQYLKDIDAIIEKLVLAKNDIKELG